MAVEKTNTNYVFAYLRYKTAFITKRANNMTGAYTCLVKIKNRTPDIPMPAEHHDTSFCPFSALSCTSRIFTAPATINATKITQYTIAQNKDISI